MAKKEKAANYLKQRVQDATLLKDFRLIDKEKHNIKDLTKEIPGSEIITKKGWGYKFTYPTIESFTSMFTTKDVKKLESLLSPKHLEKAKKLISSKKSSSKKMEEISQLYDSTFNKAIKLEQSLSRIDNENNLSKKETGSGNVFLVEEIFEGKIDGNEFFRAPLVFKEATLKRDIMKRTVNISFKSDSKIVPNFYLIYSIAASKNIIIDNYIRECKWTKDTYIDDIKLIMSILKIKYATDLKTINKVSTSAPGMSAKEKSLRSKEMFDKLEIARFLDFVINDIILGASLLFEGVSEETAISYTFLTKNNKEIEEGIKASKEIEQLYNNEDSELNSDYDDEYNNVYDFTLPYWNEHDWKEDAEKIRNEFKLFKENQLTDEDAYNEIRDEFALQMMTVNYINWEQYLSFVEDKEQLAQLIENDVFIENSPKIKSIRYLFKTDKLKSKKLQDEIIQVIDEGIIEEIENNKFNTKNNKLKSESEISWCYNSDYSQRKAVRNAISSNAHIIQGPPGTGKTQTILNLIGELIKQDKKILIVSEKKTAVEVIAKRIKESEESLFPSYVELYRNDILESVKELTKTIENSKTTKKLKNIKFSSNKEKLNSIRSLIECVDSVSLDDFIRIEELKNLNIKEIKNIIELQKIVRNKKDFDSKKEVLKNLVKIDKFNESNHINEKTKNNLYDALPSLESYYLVLQNKKRKPWFWSSAKLTKMSELDVRTVNTFDFYVNKNMKKFLKEDVEFYKIFSDYKNFKKWDYFDIVVEDDADVYSRLNKLQILIRDNSKVDYENFNNDEIFEENRRKLLNKLSKITEGYFCTRPQEERTYTNLVERKNVTKVVRGFVEENWESIEILFPVVIGTVETVSENLPLEKDMFDYLIIDEASQMYIERALPSIYRSKNIVISGDKQQLRPFKFGGKQISGQNINDVEIDYRNWVENESILDLFSLILAPEDQTMLQTHYRSKSYGLIKYSNDNFYDSKLSFIPSKDSIKNSVELHRVENDWSNQTSQNEIKKILELAEASVKAGQPSIGIISMSDKQCSEMNKYFLRNGSEQLQKLLNSNDEEGIFIKALNDVQGDERDVILFSIGYDGSRASYGHINKMHGENRLNVAASRAREKIIVVMNGDPLKMKGRELKNRGVDAFLNFIEYAYIQNEKNEIKNDDLISEDFKKHLKKQGIKKFEIHSDDKFNVVIDSKNNSYFEITKEMMEFPKNNLWKYIDLLKVRGYDIDYYFKVEELIKEAEDNGYLEKLKKENIATSKNKSNIKIW